MTTRGLGAPLSAMLISAFLALANSTPAQANPPLVISATVDYTQKTLTINGQNFGSTPTITLGAMTLPTKPGASGNLIVGNFPSNMPPSGTYFLTVRFTNQAPAVFVVDIDADGATGSRYVANGDGTVTDNQTGLMWERKTGTVDTSNPSDVHDVNNLYSWSSGLVQPDGTLFTTFLATLNGGDYYNPTDMLDESALPGTCFANHCDWRIPTIVELQAILLAPCGTTPCIDSTFGPTQESDYWSSTSFAGDPTVAWSATFHFKGKGLSGNKRLSTYARAVRSGR